MNKSVTKFIKTVKRGFGKRSPEILLGIGIASGITATVLAVKATPKALELLTEKRYEKYGDTLKEDDSYDDMPELKPVEVVKTTWKCYIPAAISGVASIACLLGSHSVHAKRNAALATAYKLSETALNEYREKVVEEIGEEKEKVIRDKVSQKHLWSTDEEDVINMVDAALYEYTKKQEEHAIDELNTKYMWDSNSGSIDAWHKYCQKQMRDNYHPLDEKIIFGDTKTTKKDYASRTLSYPLRECNISGYEKLMSTLYSPGERKKIEWAIGAVIEGDSKNIQKFMVLYGSAGTGKSTTQVMPYLQQILQIVQQTQQNQPRPMLRPRQMLPKILLIVRIIKLTI